MPLKGQNDCLTDDAEKGKQTKSSLVIEKENGKSDCFLINYKTNNKLHEKQHPSVSMICSTFTLALLSWFNPSWQLSTTQPLPQSPSRKDGEEVNWKGKSEKTRGLR